MADSADELISKMQHLEAQARATLEAKSARDGLDRLKSAAQKLAWKTQAEVTALEKVRDDGDARLEEIRKDGVTPQEAPEFVKVRAAIEDANKRLIRARAQLNFALDRMSEVERREYEAFHAEVRAETHGHLADGT
ncbi:MAG: hypothetical protein IPJ65_20320 [Archangiaceae bacterium]|nr:hypothetical protein [Archangiaceae bacterium]